MHHKIIKRSSKSFLFWVGGEVFAAVNPVICKILTSGCSWVQINQQACKNSFGCWGGCMTPSIRFISKDSQTLITPTQSNKKTKHDTRRNSCLNLTSGNTQSFGPEWTCSEETVQIRSLITVPMCWKLSMWFHKVTFVQLLWWSALNSQREAVVDKWLHIKELNSVELYRNKSNYQVHD